MLYDVLPHFPPESFHALPWSFHLRRTCVPYGKAQYLLHRSYEPLPHHEEYLHSYVPADEYTYQPASLIRQSHRKVLQPVFLPYHYKLHLYFRSERYNRLLSTQHRQFLRYGFYNRYSMHLHLIHNIYPYHEPQQQHEKSYRHEP